uniref:TF-B3 domain-containing protein n=1 Tax=Setaria viridis TaxID=4556 RepID=A0A4V6DAE9_SETVI|nr:B3 domain-containing protein LOC_Os12g40080-like [Setaria viridis]TKW29336.1 hypothetical protein SEVIR_3G388900v2 [Setaria viridis]
MNKPSTVCKECIAHHYWHHMDDQKRFFKVMMGDFKNGVTIPRKFVANIREHLSEELKLEAPDGKTYAVQVATEQNELVLRTGWPDFATAYELKFGDLLVFRNCKNSHFKVRLFDPSGCEKELSCVLMDGAPCVQERKVSHGDHTQSPTGKRMEIGSPSGSRKTSKMNPIDSPSQRRGHVPSARTKSPRHGVAKPPYILPRYTTLNDQQKNEVDKKVGAIESKIPIYVATMCNSNTARAFLEFAIDYATKYLPRENQTMRLRRPGPSKDDTWEAVFRVKNRRYTLGRGWRHFVDDNKLKPGDICLFSLMKNTKKLTMDVHIIRKRSM